MADRVAESLFDDLADNIDLLTRVLLESGCDKCSDASQALPKIDLLVDLSTQGYRITRVIGPSQGGRKHCARLIDCVFIRCHIISHYSAINGKRAGREL